MSKKNPPTSRKDFEALQKIWYQKLKDSGFTDIEDTHHPQRPLKAFHADYFRYHYKPERFEFRAEYYRLCSWFLHTHRFKEKYERFIWELHTEGVSCRRISLLLKGSGLLPKGKTLKKTMIHRLIRDWIQLALKKRDRESYLLDE